MEKIGKRPFFQCSPDADGKMHASIHHIPSSYLAYNVVHSYVMRGLKFRQLLKLYLLKVSRPKELKHQFFADTSMHKNDDLVRCFIQIHSLIGKGSLGQYQILRQDCNALLILLIFIKLQEISRKRLIIINIQSERIDMRVILRSEEVRIALVQFQQLMYPQICSVVVVEEESTVEDGVQVAQ